MITFDFKLAQKLMMCLVLISLSACEGTQPRPYARIPKLGTLYGPLTAYCDMEFGDRGLIDIEADYLPHVINCENGGAGLEALKAQAVAARSYLYYKLNAYGSIGDSQNDQVYSCGREPGPQHYEAVEATSGEVLSYQNEVIAAFYVAGARPMPPMCIANSSDPDPYNTERFVTYNQGLSGDQINQSSIGWVNPANIYNRGCKSQNGASCLSNAGMTYQNILKFYYGEDIVIERSEGACILEEMAGTEPPVEMAGMEPPVEMAGMEPPVEMAGMEPPVEMAGTEPPVEMAGTEPPVEMAGMEPPVEMAGTEPPVEMEEPMTIIPPQNLGTCVLNSLPMTYSANEACVWQECSNENNDNQPQESEEILNQECLNPMNCSITWQLRSNQDTVYAIYLELDSAQLENNQSLDYQIELSGLIKLRHQKQVNNQSKLLLGWAKLEPSEQLLVRINKACLDQTTIKRLSFDPIAEEAIHTENLLGLSLTPEPESVGGPSCAQQKHRFLDLGYVLIYLLLSYLAKSTLYLRQKSLFQIKHLHQNKHG